MDTPVILIIALLGLIVGSFLNVLIARLPLPEPEQRSVGGRSRCPRCEAKIAWYDNVPLLSWLALRARCRHCKERISVRYPVVELLNAGLWAAVAYAATDVRDVVPGLLFMSLLVAITFIDIDCKRIPNVLTYPGTLTALALGIALGPADRFYSDERWWLEVVLATVLAGMFLLIAALAKPGGMGIGDVKLAAMMGAFLGAPVAVALFAGFVLGMLPSIVLLAMHGAKGMKMKIPFGPFLAGGGVVGWFWGLPLLQAYLGTF